MKNFKFISAIALTMLMASCDDFDLPNPPGQTNGEPTGIFEASGLVLEQGSGVANLQEANDANKNVPVASIKELVNFPAEYTLAIEMEVANSNDFSTVATIPTVITDNEVAVRPDLFNGAIQQVKTKAPGEYDMNVRFVGYATKGATKMRLGSMTQTYLPEVIKVKTLNAAKVIEDAYWFVPCDAAGNPQLSKAMKMNNTAGDVSPYDNPEFALKFDVTEQESIDGYKWMIAPQSAITAGDAKGLYGCNPSPESVLAGKLGNSYGAGVVNLMGSVLVTINMELDSYTVNYAFENLWPLSGTTLMKPANALMLYTDNYINYQGVSVLQASWYLCAQPNRAGIQFRQDAELGFTDSEDGLTRNGALTSNSDGATLSTPVKGTNLYWMDVNLVMLTYNITAINTLSVVGSGNDWNEKEAPELTPNKDKTVWTAENIKVGDNFKINANHAWTIDFGGSKLEDVTGKQVFNVSYKGSNCEATPGTYKVTVDFRTMPYTVTLE